MKREYIIKYYEVATKYAKFRNNYEYHTFSRQNYLAMYESIYQDHRLEITELLFVDKDEVWNGNWL